MKYALTLLLITLFSCGTTPQYQSKYRHAVLIQWHQDLCAHCYTTIYRSTVEHHSCRKSFLANTASGKHWYMDEDVKAGETYYYSLSSTLDMQESTCTAEIHVTVPLTEPNKQLQPPDNNTWPAVIDPRISVA